MKFFARFAMAAAIAVPAVAQPAAFSPQAHRNVVAGPPTEVMVLGSAHLSQLPEGLEDIDLEPLLDRLAAWRPEIITIENLSGLDCAVLREYVEINPDTAEDYCRDPQAALSALGLTGPRAVIAAEQAWRSWPETPEAGQRRHMATLLLAAGDPASALVQWLRLPEADRRSGDGLTEALVGELEMLSTRRNESYAIAAHLAARLGLERVYPIDDHTGSDPIFETPQYGEAIQRAWSGPGSVARIAADEAAQSALRETGDVTAFYRAMNAPGYPDLVFAHDFGAALADDTEGWPGRHYAAWWEVRNLRMVANMHAVLARHPGAKALSIVGASHKGYFDAYLEMMTPVRVVDTNEVLGGAED